MSPGWGWTPPSGGGTPPASLNPADGLQDVVDALAAVGQGGVIDLGNGTYYADPANPSTPLTIPAAAYNLTIRGTTEQGTIIGSPILCQAGKLRLSDMHIDPPAGSAYGVKVYNGGSPFLSRHNLERVIIGDRAQVRANGPTKGLHLDGAGIIQCSNCTFAYCSGDGIYVDSTGAEPNTALQFDMCSFVGNGGYGINLLGSCNIAEFRGGNSEQNVTGEVSADGMNNLLFHAFDFESTTVALTNQVSVNNCRPVSFRDCNFFVSAPGSATRALIVSSCNQVCVERNIIGGYGAVGVVRLDENCSQARIEGNNIGSGPWIEDYSR